MVSRNLLSFMDDETLENRLAAAAAAGGKRKSWDDEFVLKRQFSALIPAFDPRPGRTNVNQTSDLDIPAPGSLADAAYSASGLLLAPGGCSAAGAAAGSAGALMPAQPALSLMLKGPNLGSAGATAAPTAMAALGTAGNAGAASAASVTGPLATACGTLTLATSSYPGGDVEIPLHNPDWTIFRAVQELMQASTMNKHDKMRKVSCRSFVFYLFHHH